MADCRGPRLFSDLNNAFKKDPQMMASRASLYRHKMKKEDPEAYQRFLEKQRERNKAARDEEKRKWEEEPHTRAQIEERKAKLKAQREKQMEYYYKKKAERERQTRNSRIGPKRTPDQKRPKDMDKDELRAYNSLMRRKQRDARSSQKKTADNMKQRRRRQAKKEALLRANQPPESTETNGRARLPQKAYNLNHEFKSKSKKMRLSHEEYAQTALNLLNPRTPEKRAAIAIIQRQHPCRILFVSEMEYDLEEELGIIILDEPAPNVADLEPCSNSLHQHIQIFYCDDAVTRLLPHARYTTKHGAARVMTMTLKAAYELFKDRHPDIKVGLTLFQQQRPRNVRLLGSVPIESCLCIYCTNVRLKITSLNRLLGQSGKLPSEGKLLNFVNCPVSKRWNDIACIDGKCDKCKDRLRPMKIFCRDIMDLDNIMWRRWSRNSESGKMEPISVTGSVLDLLEEFAKDIEEPSRGVSFPQHLFTAYWQYDQYKMNRRNPADGEIVMVQDFAENRKACYAEEIKSAHFGKNQITVHPMVCYYRKGDDIVRHTIMAFSDDIGHDHHAVNSFTLAALDILKKEGSFTSLTMWSDGAASQYKGKGSFADLSLLTGLDVQRCFFGSEHGKGEADGETGVLSQMLRRASSGDQSFAKAEDMVTYLSRHHSLNTDLKKRQYLVLKDINRDRPETEVQTIPGTRSYHQFRRLAPYIIQARRLACFCTGCTNGYNEACVNKDYVGEFVTHKLKPSVQTALNEAFLDEPGHTSKSKQEDANQSLDEFDVISVAEPKHNRSPFILQEHKLGIEAWAAKILLKYTANRLIGWRRRLPEDKFIDPVEICHLCRAVLLFNPDNYTAWNIRKEMIENGTLTISEDLALGALVLSKHPKSPETFIHRRWLFQQLLDYCLSSSSGSNASCSGAGAASTTNEDSLVNVEAIDVDVSCSSNIDTPSIGAFTLEASRMLVSHTQRELRVSQSAAERYPCNYHAWSHRIWIIRHCLNCSLNVLQSELKATEEWTRKHISDHSGFHYRQFLLSELLAHRGKQIVTNSLGHGDILQQEMEYVVDLIQSFPGHEALWYHRRYIMNEILRSNSTLIGSQDCIGDEGNLERNQNGRAQQINLEMYVVTKRLGSCSHKHERHLIKNYQDWLERQK